MKKILILLLLLINLSYSKEIIINSDLNDEHIEKMLSNITEKEDTSSIMTKFSFDKIGYQYSIGWLSEDKDKYAHSHSLYITKIYNNIGLNFIKKTHSSNYTYDILGFGLNYPISRKWLVSINKISGKGNNKDIEGIDTSLFYLKRNYGFSLGYDSILKQFNVGITLLKGFK